MIVCVDASAEGGETILHFNEDFKYASKATITPGGCLLFRKDITHEGSPLRSGHKEILTFNVWLIKEDCSQILAVRCKDGQTILLSIDKVINNHPDSLLHVFLTSELTKGRRNTRVITYSTDYDHRAFSVIAKIYNGEALSHIDVRKYGNVIDYYLLNKDRLLIKYFVDNNPLKVKLDLYRKDDDLIIFGSNEPYQEFLETIKIDRLPYVPFKVIFVEGTMAYGGEMSGTPPLSLKMTPVWCSFSENDNLLYFANLMNESSFTPTMDMKCKFQDCLWSAEEQKKYMDRNGDRFYLTFDKKGDDTRFNLDEETACGSSLNVNLECCVLEASHNNIIQNMSEYDGGYSLFRMHLRKNTDVPDDVGPYALDEENRCVLNQKHIDELMGIMSPDFYTRIADSLNSIVIPNSQRTMQSVKADYCNENVYGNFNFLAIYGALRMPGY